MTTLGGVYAALLTPRKPDRNVDTARLGTLIRFLMAKGVTSFALNGATGEYCLSTPDQLRLLADTARAAAGDASSLLCGIGGPDSSLSIKLASIAESSGIDGLLLPMPYFFPYEQNDLEAFCSEVAAATSLPILLYNLPQFTSSLHSSTVRRLLQEVPNIVGIKDSGSSDDILRELTHTAVPARRIVGNDSMLAGCLRDGICDGLVSGVACVLPELIMALYAERGNPGSPAFQTASQLLAEFIEQIASLPTPWGLKWVAEARGLHPAVFALPLADSRAAEGAALVAWLLGWFPNAMARLGIEHASLTQ